MFWRFGFHNPSAIDTLLDREDIELEDILEEEDLLQEAKSHNQKLIDFLSKTENLNKLLTYITATDLDESRRFKYPFLACEIMACEIPQIVDAVVLENKGMLESFWTFLNRPAPPRRRAADDSKEQDDNDEEACLDSLQAQYFCKTISVFLTKRTGEVLDFIKSKPEHLEQILGHLQTSAIMDLLLTLVRVEELSEGKGIVQWLSDHGLLDNLVDRLDPYLDSEEHSVAQQCICEIIRMSQTSLMESPSIGLNDLIIDLKSERVIRKLADFMLDSKAPNSTSTLINGVTIVIDLIRHNNSDMDNDPMLNGAYGYGANAAIRQVSVSLADMLKVLAERVGDFNQLLIKPRSVNAPMRTTLGEQMPLGFERLKICELFAELLHCSNMSNLNDEEGEAEEDEDEKDEKEEESPKESDAVKPEDKQESDTTKDADGTTIGDYLKMQFVENRVMPTCVDLFFVFPWNNFLHYVIYDMLHQIFNGRMDKGYNRNLAISVFKDGKLTDRMVQAQKANDEECAKPKGMRLGYMGHLTFIADEIIKLFEGYPEAVLSQVKDDIDLESWNAYCNNELKETKERDRLPLAGPRPNDGLDGAATDEEDEEPMDGVTARQYSRYLSQQDGDLDDDEDEETENWITGRDDFDREYSYGTAFGMGANEGHMGGAHDDLDDDEEYGSDDDEESGRVPADWSRGFAGLPQTSMLHRTQSHIRDNEEVDEEDEQHDKSAATTKNTTTAPVNTQEDGDDDDDPFGDFTSSDSNQEWTEGFSSQFESIHISGDGNASTTAKNDNKSPVNHDYVRAVKTKEEEDAKLAKEYRPEEEQQGEI
ncbi:hypothetical protein O0I10_008531 [Lichtheimia ornata]|uniref:Uncharacterized protein n=1 Tax=Lichtheimia ornata TaxID=688661 RepID=A0AAD7XZI0_9FUNG|nr:uncharacterized protein O0I10_008531 [Lichtheimia ornata]KAJ8655867.1 hypothetical protein O0I10_008531 [Lichtheimia ornata]